MRECPGCKRCFADEIAHCPEDGEQLTPSLAGEPVLDGRYQLEARLGQGGMGVVYRARHIFLKTAHAIKVILPDLVGNDPNLATRFRQEAMAAANVRHPNIIAVTDFGIVRGNMPFLVMEYVQGESLHEILQRERILTPARVLELMSAIGSGVAAAHRQNIVHRDLKPLNVMLQDGLPINEGVRILDFGLAKIKSGEILGSFVAAQTSGLMGSPFYMAPEQWSDEEPDARADIYSLGVMTYQMLAGEVPFKGASIPSIMRKHLTEAPPPMSNLGAEIPGEIEAVVRRALEKDPANRPATVDLFLTELRTAIKGTADLNQTLIEFGKNTNPDLAIHTGGFDPNQTQISSPNMGSFPGTGISPIDQESLSKMPEAIEAQRLREQAAILEERARQSAELQRLELDRQAKEEEAKRVSGQLAKEEEARHASGQLAEEVKPLAAAPVVPPPVPPSVPPPVTPSAPMAESDGEWVNFGSTDPGRGPVNTQAIPPAEAAVKVAPAVNPAPVRPAVAPATKTSRTGLIAAVAGVILVLVIAAGGFGIYRLVRSRTAGVNGFPTPTPTATEQPTPVETPTNDLPGRQYGPNLAVIPGGKFTMGSNDGTPQEQPAHSETVATFSMDKTEVTNGEYAEFVSATGYPAPSHFLNGKPRPDEEDFPVAYVNIEDAEAFAAWRSKRDGVTYRLPTEIEWEYAARSGSKNYKFPWGNKWEPAYAVTKESGATGLAKVHSHPEGDNIWGVADLIGNVREWTSSKLSFYPGNDAIDPEQKRKALDLAVNSRVVRGSSFQAPVKVVYELSATYRDWYPATERRVYFGFRLVKSGE
jgi:serine/threonine-protein kinase